MHNGSDSERRYDVVILGGALAGASTALLVRRRHPELRVLIVERKEAFDWKVGESTVEISGYFLTRVLRLYDHLSREQLPKHGLRFWYHNGAVKGPREASEIGSGALPRLPTFQLDRAKLDEEVLRLAVEAGAELWRPAKIVDVRLPEEIGREEGVVRVERDGVETEVRAGWIVDATGRAAIIARKRGMVRPLKDHPTTAIWARFTNVRDMDGAEFAGNDLRDPFVRAYITSRRLATNHFTGYGYWMWFIPLNGGEMSIGAVWDQRLVDPPGSSAEERLRWFIDGNPLSRAVFQGAKLVPEDLRQYAHLPYFVDRLVGRGWSLVGDAAAFIDPFYSPGIDQISYSVSWTLELLKRRREIKDPAEFDEVLRFHQECYARYLRFFFEAIYRDKYYLMGDYDTMTASLLIDTALYYFFNVIPAYRGWDAMLLNPPFYLPGAKLFRPILGLHRHRLVTIARRKWALGIYGNRNAGRRPKLPGFSLGFDTLRLFLKGMGLWLRAEAENAWSYIARPRPLKAGMPGPVAIPGKSSSQDLHGPRDPALARLEVPPPPSAAPSAGERAEERKVPVL